MIDKADHELVVDLFELVKTGFARVLACVDRVELLNEKEVAAIRRKTVYALRKERARGSGPPWIKDGNAVRYRKSELLAWLDANSRETRDSEREPRFAETRRGVSK